jgi:two-component system cell cycle response regulator DivK
VWSTNLKFATARALLNGETQVPHAGSGQAAPRRNAWEAAANGDLRILASLAGKHADLGESSGETAMARYGFMMAKRVLIVEDNELNMKLFHDLLDAQGYETLQTREGLQALALARQHKPDLILMDIQLPEISGLEVTKWLKEDDELAHIPVIAVTAFAMKGDEERIREGGCEAYISKPISVAHFLETVRRFLG